MVEHLHSQTKKDSIDLLCISHFDGDHVNGMVALLEKFEVEVLALPYVPFDRRLEIAFDLAGNDSASAVAISFALDPIGFLESRRLMEKVERVLLIKGGNGPATSPTPAGEGLNRNDPDGPLQLSLNSRPGELDDYPPILDSSDVARQKLQTVADSVVGKIANADWEFVFFNRPLPKAVTPVTKAQIAVVQAEIKVAISSMDPYNKPESFFKELRSIYVKHFSDSERGRNDISLCVFSRSLRSSPASTCRLDWNLGAYPLDVTYNFIPVVDNGVKSGLLLTGDISIDVNTAEQMRTHFGELRWNELHIMQIPHHGSKRSWRIGVAKKFQNTFSVLCVPNFDSGGHHPNIDVMADIDSKNPVRADYSNSVVFTFHKG